MTITGGCLCGAVRYLAGGDVIAGLHCHCRDCQRSSGTGHVPVMVMPKALFQVQGETRSFATTGSSGLKAIRNFCPVCGSLLFGTPEMAPEIVTIYVGSLDDPSVFDADFSQFVRYRHDWDRIAASIPEYHMVPVEEAEPH